VAHGCDSSPTSRFAEAKIAELCEDELAGVFLCRHPIHTREVHALALSVGIAVNIAALGAGIWLGIWAARRVPATLSLPNANESAIRVTILLFRVFVFLICVLTVSAPVTFITDAIIRG